MGTLKTMKNFNPCRTLSKSNLTFGGLSACRKLQVILIGWAAFFNFSIRESCQTEVTGI